MAVRLNLLRHLGISVVIVLGLSCLSNALGQSGRRTPKPKTVIAPIPEPEPAPTPVKQTPQPATNFILGMEQPDGFWGISLNSVSNVRRSCAQRLDEPESIRVEVTASPMSRSDAVKRAKAEKEAYVVWLRLRDDTMSGRERGGPLNIAIEYTVFAPVTSKVFTSGATYPQGRNTSVIPGRRSSNDEYYLHRAAQEAADRILAKFNFGLPRR